MNLLEKTLGKLVTYVGFLIAIRGMISDSACIVVIGVAIIVGGCLLHELNEK